MPEPTSRTNIIHGKTHEKHAHWFSFFRALADQLVAGAPVIVYAKYLGASSTILGVIAALVPLTSILQIPAASHVERYGYHQFALMGWRFRIVASILVALVPLIPDLDPSLKLACLVLFLLFLNLSRIPISTAWLPWITAIIPIGRRGQFLSINQLHIVSGSLVLLLTAGLIMNKGPNGTSGDDLKIYSLIFAINVAGVLACRYFLRRIPEATPDQIPPNTQRIAWHVMLKHKPFAKLLGFNLLWVGTLCSLDVFRLDFLRDQEHFTATELLIVSAFSYVGAILALPLISHIFDRIGGKPMLRVSNSLYLCALMVWFLMAAEIVPCSLTLTIVLFTITGSGWGIFTVSSAHMITAAVPIEGRSHFFALYSVVLGLGMGISPILWGIILDALSGHEWVTGIIHWKQHSIYFMTILILILIAFINIKSLHETLGTPPKSA